jgi:Zn-dependent peptidase ImmA (M78 family)/transcriptional regulator with XRE-family HTH domain
MARAENINPEILAWARETARLSLEDAAARIGLTATEKQTAAEKLQELEAGEKFPTRSQLLKIASVYRRPLTAFYMKQPPRIGERGEDFRTLPASVSPRDNALLDSILRDMRARQEMVRGLIEDEDEATPLDFVGSASLQDGVLRVVDSIANTLQFDPIKKRKGSADDFFKELRTRTEATGVFVLLVGDLGSHHSAVDEKVFRGFAIADPMAPFVIINDQDAKAARSFTLLHELAHIWLGESGVSGTPESAEPTTHAGEVERFCNDVAGELLLPSAIILPRPADLNTGDKDQLLRLIRSIAGPWAVSEPMVAYRLNRLGWIAPSVYRELTSDFAARWAAAKQREKEKAKEKEGGPTYFIIRQYKLGNALIDVVRRTLRDNTLTHTKAAKVLGIKPGLVEPLIRRSERSRDFFPPEPPRG